MADSYEHYSKDELIRLIRERDRKPRLGLIWERDEIEHERSINDDFVVLEEDQSLSVGKGPQENLLIEGDNFDALRYLRMTLVGRVKCIYIDPPYNTGNRDFIYNDRFIDKDDTYKHSKWLEFMYRRLVIARDLLTDDGVIFCSIGEDEIHHLGLLMDQVFPNRKIGTMVWKTRHSADSRNLTGCSIDHEYVLCYGAKLKGSLIDVEKFSNPDADPRGPWRSADMTGLATKDKRPNLHYDLEDPSTGIIYPCSPKGWRYSRETMAKLIAENRVIWPSKPNGRPRLKKFRSELSSERKGFSTYLDAPMTSVGTKELNDVDLGDRFTFPKPTDLIAMLIDQVTGDDDIVLDFFAGSGTTGHAVLKLNEQDGARRRFILVSSTEATEEEPEKNICRDVSAERLRRAIEGYRNNKGDQLPGLGGGFTYLRTKRIPVSHVFDEIQHGHIWRALLLINDFPLVSIDSHSDVQVAFHEGNRIIYLQKMSESNLQKVMNLANENGLLKIYSWQPAQLRQHILEGNVTIEKIPEFLLKRFSGGVK